MTSRRALLVASLLSLGCAEANRDPRCPTLRDAGPGLADAPMAAATDAPIAPGADAPIATEVDAGTTPMPDAPAVPGTDGGPPGTTRLADIVDRATFEAMFPHRGDHPCPGAFFTYDALLAAAAYYPGFAATGTDDDRRREVAAFLAQISHETTGGWPTAPDGPQAWGLCFIEEVGCSGGACTGYCDASSTTYPCAAGRTYHGRGPMQLSWNYNYGQCGDAIGLPLLTDPGLVTSDPEVAFRTALWFWMTPQAPKPSCHDVMVGAFVPSASDVAAGRVPGFGLTTNIINGGLECGFPADHRVEDRIAFYRRYAGMLGVDVGPNLDCDDMDSY